MMIRFVWLRFAITASLVAMIVFTRTASSAASIFAGSEVVAKINQDPLLGILGRLKVNGMHIDSHLF